MDSDTLAEERYAADVKHYEREDIVRDWLNRYAIEKERQFIKSIDRFIPSNQVKLLDIGCGTGLHTFLWHEQNKAVTASDLSTRFQDYILQTYPFPFIRMDVLHCTTTEQYDICFCMGLATLVLDEQRRFQTFEALAKLVRPGSYVILITGSNQWPFVRFSNGVTLHSIDGRDLEKLEQLGLPVERAFYWGSSPRCLWHSRALRLLGRGIEAVSSRLGIGARKVVICHRAPNSRN
jgi:SAM-dependent methyltransferase